MSNLKIYGPLLMSTLLIACGGGDVVQSGNSTPPSGEGPIGGDNSGGDVNVVLLEPVLGNGVGASFTAGQLSLSLDALSAGGAAWIEASIVDSAKGNNLITSQSYTVIFNSECLNSIPAKAELSQKEVLTGTGKVAVTYTAKGCVGEDIITAQLLIDGQVEKIATGTLTVAPAEVGSISFVGVDSSALSIATIANPVLPTQAKVTFKVMDKFGDPISNKEVKFFLGNNYNDMELARDSNLTDSSGMVSAIVNSGTTHGIAIVNATTLASDGQTEIRTSSQPISVTSGLPRQDRFSISAETFNPAAFNVDGVEVKITVRASDAFGNHVPQGTIVNFTAESGGINSSCNIENNGSCVVTWVSGGVRPGQNYPAYNLVNDGLGLTTILAYTLGEAGFTDKNSNYILDSDDDFMAYGEAFRDDNWDSVRDDSEFYVDTNSDGEYSSAVNPAVYQGALCSDDMKGAGHCESLMHVRAQLRIVQSLDDKPVIRIFDCSSAAPACSEFDYTDLEVLDKTVGGEFYVVLQDKHGNMPPSETTLAIEGEAYNIRADVGKVNNNIGELADTDYALGFTGLPSFGMLYKVEYKPLVAYAGEDPAIKLEAVYSDKISQLFLDPAP